MSEGMKRGKYRERKRYEPRNTSYRIRVNKRELEFLEDISKDLGVSKCSAIFMGLNMLRDYINDSKAKEFNNERKKKTGKTEK